MGLLSGRGRDIIIDSKSYSYLCALVKEHLPRLIELVEQEEIEIGDAEVEASGSKCRTKRPTLVTDILQSAGAQLLS